MPAPTSSQPGTLHIIIHSKEKFTPAPKAPATNQRKESVISWPDSMRVTRVVEAGYSRGCVAGYIRNSVIDKDSQDITEGLARAVSG